LWKVGRAFQRSPARRPLRRRFLDAEFTEIVAGRTQVAVQKLREISPGTPNERLLSPVKQAQPSGTGQPSVLPQTPFELSRHSTQFHLDVAALRREM
jgi:hypothetical protein